MAARIVHMGGDGCSRLAVLQSAGYMVQDCASLPEFVTALNCPPDAVVLTELDGDPNEAVLAVARECSPVPVILFQSPDCHCPVWEFDLVIPNLTPPRSWLDKIAALIECSKALRVERPTLREESASLRLESAAMRQRCEEERDKIRLVLDRKPPPIAGSENR